MNPAPPLFLLRVATTWPLPGLGLLALPNGPTPYLSTCDLHMALVVAIQQPDGIHRTGRATVEEVSRADDAPTRGLLLDLADSRQLLEGTTIWLAGPSVGPA